ncbi:30S ribosomal protein S6 [Candidatus Dependentiae bacterium]|nr:30S ribosomal protein S6 [Candidatus Dependentiae bacterium]
MFRYEILMLAIPEITQDESKKLESHLDKIVQDAKANIISFERWGKYRLAYPVKNNDYGVYYLARFETEQIGLLLDEIKTLFRVKLYDIVIRSMITRLDASGSLNYQRPPSLEEAPSRDVSSFLTDSLSGSRRRGRSRGDWGSRSEQKEAATQSAFVGSDQKDNVAITDKEAEVSND